MSFLGIKNFSSRQKSGLIILSLGFLFLLTSFIFKSCQNLSEKSLFFSQLPSASEAKIEDYPERISISRINLDLPVLPAKVTVDNWEIFDKEAAYLLGSGLPGEKGNLVIYAHNKNRLFGPIRGLKKGDLIKIISKGNKEYLYQVRETKIVDPEAIEVLESSEDFRLTLYTCTGFLDKKRWVVVARLQP